MLPKCAQVFEKCIKLRDDLPMNSGEYPPIKVMRVIARMNVGGPAVQISGLMRNLKSPMFEHVLVTGYCGLDEEDYLKNSASDIKAVRIRGFGASINLANDIRATLELMTLIRKIKPDIIHTHTFKAGFLGRIASLLSLQKSFRVHTYHGHLLFGYYSSNKTKVIIFIERFLAIFTHKLIAVGENVKKDLIDARIGGESKYSTIPPGIELGSQIQKFDAKKLLGLKTDVVYGGFIGRLTHIKRLDRFIDVVRELKLRKVEVSFFVAGGGEMRTNLETLTHKESLPITFLGWRNDIENVLSASDFVILTSDNEGTPISLIQAGIFGIPTISTNVGSVSEVISDGLTGILVNPDIKSICDAVERVVLDPGLRSNLGREARSYTKSRYSVARMVDDHEKLYVDLVSNTRTVRH
jgi:glycosyltransferase involved in cell wall biosynthesis